MGACYSKQHVLGHSSKSKAPKSKYHGPRDNDIARDKTECTPGVNGHDERVGLISNGSDGALNKDNTEDVIVVSSSLFLAAESASTTQCKKAGEGGVAPSDSGIESIGTIPDDPHEFNVTSYKKSDISRRLERLSRGSCHKCGNFKLDDSAITALFANSYCLCGPRQAGRSNVNPKCQTHGARNVKKEADGTNGVSEDGIGGGKNKSYLTPEAHCCASNQDNESKIFWDSVVQAPLAHFDSVDFNLNDSPMQNSTKRRSLLSEILDLTDSICKCDFYSNEYCCIIDPHAKSESPAIATKRVNEPVLERFLPDVSFESQASDCTLTKSDNEEQMGVMHSAENNIVKSNLSTPKKTLILTKNVSFAHEDASEDVLASLCAQPNSVSPNKCNKHSKDVEHPTTVSDASSGVFTFSGSVSETLLTRFKDSPKRTLSLGSPAAALLSSSSSDALDNCTEDDLASLDLDSLSRVTSLSYGSIRQLMESTEDLVQPLEDVRKIVIDGEEHVAIPTEVYFQLQSDLESLRHQLLFLSSVIQEVCDRRETDPQGLSASFNT